MNNKIWYIWDIVEDIGLLYPPLYVDSDGEINVFVGYWPQEVINEAYIEIPRS